MKPMKAKFPDVSFADLFQMASAAAIEAAGGPKIAMQYGRKDVTDEQVRGAHSGGAAASSLGISKGNVFQTRRLTAQRAQLMLWLGNGFVRACMRAWE
jgi:hypothetical protein